VTWRPRDFYQLRRRRQLSPRDSSLDEGNYLLLLNSPYYFY